MYRFQILAYEEELKDASSEIPFLNKVTEIWIIAKDAAEAMAEAKSIYITTHYHIRRIDKIIEGQQPGAITPGQGTIR